MSQTDNAPQQSPPRIASPAAGQDATAATRGTLNQHIHSTWEATRDLLNIIGYALAACLILYALSKPDSVKAYIDKIGLHEVKAGPIELGFDITPTADALTRVSERVDELDKQLKEANASVANPEAKAKIESVANQAVILRQDLTKADENLRNAIAKQTQQSQSANLANTLSGWIFLGRTDGSVTHWDTPRPNRSPCRSVLELDQNFSPDRV